MVQSLRSAIGVNNRTPIPFSSPRGGGGVIGGVASLLGKRKLTAQMEAVGDVGTLYAIVDRLTESLSQVNWHLYRKSTTDDPDDRTEVLRHPAKYVWDRPNKFYTQNEFEECFQQHFELTGESWWVLQRVDGFSMPIAMWSVRPDRMEPVPSETSFIAGYVYHGPDGEKIPLSVDDVIFFRKPNPLDPHRGLGAVQSILTDLDASRMSAQWVRNFFRNSAEPGGIVEVERRLGEDEFNELRDRWRSQHQGVSQAHRVAILEQGKWVERKYSMRDMQFNDVRNAGREMIRESFGFPKPLLGTVDDVNRANADAAEVMFARWLVVPRLNRLKMVLNTYFLPLFSDDDTLEFDYEDPVPEDLQTKLMDRQSKAVSAKQLVEAGYHHDDVADAVGLPRMRMGEGPPRITKANQENGNGNSSGQTEDVLVLSGVSK